MKNAPPTNYPPLPTTHRDRREHDAELLEVVREFGPAPLVWIFDGAKPRWATDAAARLLRAGLIEEVFGATEDEVLELTDAGRRVLDASRRPVAA